MNVAAILKVKGRNVVTTTADKSLLDVAKLLEQHDIGCLVIEGDDGQVAGIVSERDLVRAIGKSGAKVLKEPVSVYMTRTVVTAREADPIDRLMSEMTVHRFRHMPVVERGRLIGLVSIGDLVKIHIAEIEITRFADATIAYDVIVYVKHRCPHADRIQLKVLPSGRLQNFKLKLILVGEGQVFSVRISILPVEITHPPFVGRFFGRLQISLEDGEGIAVVGN